LIVGNISSISIIDIYVLWLQIEIIKQNVNT
jgi:hypothetical protein